MNPLRRRYGAGPLHLLGVLGCLAVTGYVASRLHLDSTTLRIVVWFALAAVAHDLLLYPVYALADRLLVEGAGGHRPGGVPVVNHVRVPVLLSLLLLLIWFPLITRRSAGVYRANVGLPEEGYLARWLLVSGALLLGSLLVYVGRLAVRARSPHEDRSSRDARL